MTGILFVLLFMTIALVSLAAASPIGPPVAVRPRQLVARRAATPPLIDGRLDDACWRDAASATGFSIYSDPDVLHPEQTIGRVCFDDDFLYIAVECTVAEMDKFTARLAQADGQFLYSHGGAIEVFLDPRHDGRGFQQYMLHANGSAMVTLSPGDGLKILDQEHLRSATAITPTGFTIEMAFPLAMLHLRPGTGPVWGFNLNRAHDLYYERHDSDGFFSSWNSTRGHAFQSPDYFGELRIDQDLSRYFWRVELPNEPRAGDRAIRILVGNETGKPFRGAMMLTITPAQGADAVLEEKVTLGVDQQVELVFGHAVSSRDVEARYELTLRNDDGAVVYLGGTQKRDLTPGDAWAAPAPTDAEQRQGYLIFQRPLTHPVLHRAAPKADERVESLSARGCAGTLVPVTFALYPLSNVADVRVSVGDLRGPAGAGIAASAVDVRMVTHQSDWRDPRAFEAKEHLLRHFTAVNLAQGAAQRFWLTIALAAHLPPGDYTGTLHITCAKGETTLPLTITVLPIVLEGVDDLGFFMYYRGVQEPSFGNVAFFRKIVRDMRRHGMTTFTIYHSWPDGIDVDGHRGRYGVTYAEIIAILQEEGFGHDAPLIDVTTAWHYSPEMVLELQRIYKERNWPRVVYYVEDEIDYPERIDMARRKLEALRAASPDIRFTTALGDKGADALGHMYDIWIGCSTQARVNRAAAMGKAPWTYSCRAVYDVGPGYMRWFYGAYPWKIGLRGIALWSYTDDDTFYDRFGRKHAYGEFKFTPDFKQEYGHVVLEGDDIVPAVTWEAVREGIYDYRYMRTLQRMAEAAAQGGGSAQAAAQAGLRVLADIAARTELTPVLSEAAELRWQLRDWRIMGDPDGDRQRVIEAILAIAANQP